MLAKYHRCRLFRILLNEKIPKYNRLYESITQNLNLNKVRSDKTIGSVLSIQGHTFFRLHWGFKSVYTFYK